MNGWPAGRIGSVRLSYVLSTIVLVNTFDHGSVETGHVEEFRYDDTTTRMSTRVSVVSFLIEHSKMLWVARSSKGEVPHAGWILLEWIPKSS